MWPFDPWVASLFRILPITWLCRLRKTLPCSGEERLIRQLFVKGLVGQLACKVIWVCVCISWTASHWGKESRRDCVCVREQKRERVYTVIPGRQPAIRGSFINVTAPVKLNTPPHWDCHGNTEKWMPLWALMSMVIWEEESVCESHREENLWRNADEYRNVCAGTRQNTALMRFLWRTLLNTYRLFLEFSGADPFSLCLIQIKLSS